MKYTEERYEKDIVSLIEKKKKDLKVREEDMAREILIKSIQQYAGEVTGETTQTMVQLESDDLKWKIIGKEGRNIIAFEKATWVSLIIDDAPDTVFLSSFDLFRRYIAKKSLEDLIADKRIQPARIEEIVEKNQQEADKLIYDLGRKTIDEMGVIGIPDEIVPLIGKFRFRTSYGQNILMHSKEVAYIAEAIAKLIGADPVLALKWWLLHDLGKAMDHDIEWTHPEIGGRIARKYGLDEKTVNIIEGHHDDVPMLCIETKIVQIADAISAVRPGARRMNVEDYIKRIGEMENIAMSFPGVGKAYALSAGREIRVFVDSDLVSDLDAEKKAQEIAANIEANCSYPGEVKVIVYREKKIVQYAK
jgi:ribonuclease Y